MSFVLEWRLKKHRAKHTENKENREFLRTMAAQRCGSNLIQASIILGSGTVGDLFYSFRFKQLNLYQPVPVVTSNFGVPTISFSFSPVIVGFFRVHFLFQNLPVFRICLLQYSKPVLQPILDGRVPIFCTVCAAVQSRFGLHDAQYFLLLQKQFGDLKVCERSLAFVFPNYLRLIF